MKTEELKQKAKGWIDTIAAQDRANSTIKTYRNALNVFLDYIKDTKPSEIDQETLTGYKHYLNQQKEDGQIKLSTINTRIVVLNKFLRESGEAGLRLRTEKQQRQHVLNDSLTLIDYSRLLRWANKLNMEREALIMKTLVNTGIRISELEFFTVESLKPLKGRRNSQGLEVKNKGKTRKVYPTPSLIKELLEYCKNNGIESGVIFHGNSPDKLLDKTQIWRNLKLIAGRARVKKSRVHAHSFRHLFAKEYLDRPGANITTLADILGHESIETTRIYITGTDQEQSSDVKDVAESIEKKLKGLNKK